jgi:3-oxoacyl-[acyl-carrier protein] reductase
MRPGAKGVDSLDRFLEGQVALVTGGTRGIGLAIAQSLIEAGARTIICARSKDSVEKALKALSPLGEVRGIAADVAREEQVQKLFEFVDETYGSLDVLINNAGIGIFKSVGELTPEEWKKVIETNLNSAFFCSHAALPRLKKSKAPYIINISSLAGKNPFAGGAAYNASKFGMNGFSEALFLDHRQDDVRVSYIMPGSVDTDFSPRSKSASWKIAPEDIATLVLSVLRMPTRTMVSRIEVRPSKPQKD